MGLHCREGPAQGLQPFARGPDAGLDRDFDDGGGIPVPVVRQLDGHFAHRAGAADEAVELDHVVPEEADGAVRAARGEIQLVAVHESGQHGALALPGIERQSAEDRVVDAQGFHLVLEGHAGKELREHG